MTDNKFNMDGFYAVPKAEWDHQADTITALRREVEQWKSLADRADEIMGRMSEDSAALEARVAEQNDALNRIGAQVDRIRFSTHKSVQRVEVKSLLKMFDPESAKYLPPTAQEGE